MKPSSKWNHDPKMFRFERHFSEPWCMEASARKSWGDWCVLVLCLSIFVLYLVTL